MERLNSTPQGPFQSTESWTQSKGRHIQTSVCYTRAAHIADFQQIPNKGDRNKPQVCGKRCCLQLSLNYLFWEQGILSLSSIHWGGRTPVSRWLLPLFLAHIPHLQRECFYGSKPLMEKVLPNRLSSLQAREGPLLHAWSLTILVERAQGSFSRSAAEWAGWGPSVLLSHYLIRLSRAARNGFSKEIRRKVKK